MSFTPFSLNCNGRLLTADRPLVMGILNATPDSFHADSRTDLQRVGADAGAMEDQGARLIDIGGMSSRPGAELITAQEETDRVLPIIEAVARDAPKVIISCDTVWSDTARAAVAAGAGIINDISAGQYDEALLPTVAALNVPYVLMHLPTGATPATMQEYTKTYNDRVVTHVWDFLARHLAVLRELGIHDVVVDPGFGFGKSQKQNYELLKNLHVFRHLGAPVLAGMSRKGMLYKPLKTTPSGSLAATAAVNLYALQQGASILRVHDVKEGVEVVRLHRLLEETRLVGE